LGETTQFLKVTNTKGTTITLPPEYLLTLPKTTVYAELYCYGNLVTDGYWGGFKLTDLLSQVGGLDENIGSIYFEAQDGYKVHIPIKTAIREDVIIAYEKDEVPLPESPRLVIPNTNGNLWIAYITSIILSAEQISEGQSSDTDSSANIPFTPSQPSKLLHPQGQPTPTIQPDSDTSIKPVSPPENTLQEPRTDQNSTKQHNQEAYAMDLGMKVSFAVLASILMASAVMFVALRRRKRTSSKGA
jgi:DMSO/TMAO reductase YedYZ molybdopterin-dependent catalytic subunit